MIRCSRCERVAPVTEEEQAQPLPALWDTPNDPTLPVIVPVPDGWIPDPDDDGMLCSVCATSEEITDWMRQMEQIERIDPD